MEKFSEFINNLTEEELDLIEREIKEGTIQKTITMKKEFLKIKGKICPVCGNSVEEDCLVLIFGEPTLRKKAHFCGIDCMEYFINNFIKKTQKIEKRSKEESIQNKICRDKSCR